MQPQQVDSDGTQDLLAFFLDVEMSVHSSSKSIASLDSDKFTVDNSFWNIGNRYISGVLDDSIDVSRSTLECIRSIAPEDIEKANIHLERYKELWQTLIPFVDGRPFYANMRLLFKTKVSDRRLNYVAEILLIIKDKDKLKKSNEDNWTFFIGQYKGASIDNNIGKFQAELLQYKPQFDYEKVAVTTLDKPFLSREMWTRVRLYMNNMEDKFFNGNCSSIQDAINRCRRKDAARKIIVLWIHLLIVHDDYFFCDDNLLSRGVLLTAVFAKKVNTTAHEMLIYHEDLNRNEIMIPSNALSVALLSLLDIFSVGSKENAMLKHLTTFEELMKCAQHEFPEEMMSKQPHAFCNPSKYSFEEYVILLIDHVIFFYFSDLQYGDDSNFYSPRTLDVETEQSVFQSLFLIILPLTVHKLWRAACLLMEKISLIHRHRNFPFSREKNYRLCTELFAGDLDLFVEWKTKSCDLLSQEPFRPFASLRVFSPIDFAVRDGNIMFLKSFFDFFPEARLEVDVTSAVMSTKRDVYDSDLAFLFSGCVLEDELPRDSFNRCLHVNEDMRCWFLKIAESMDARRVTLGRVPWDRFVGQSSLSLADVKISSLHGFCENSNAEIVLCDGRTVSVSSFVCNINNYLFSLPSPLRPRGHHHGHSFLHVAFSDDIPLFVTEFLLSWAVRSETRLRYLLVDFDGVTPINILLNRRNFVGATGIIRHATGHMLYCKDQMGILSHTSTYRGIDLNALFLVPAMNAAIAAKRKIATIPNTPSREELFTILLQRNLSSVQKLWSLISKTDFRQLFSVMYSSRGSNLDCIIRVKRLMSLLGIPCSRFGVTEAASTDGEYDSVFVNTSPTRLKHFLTFSKAAEVKKIILGWIQTRFGSSKRSQDVACHLFHHRADVSMLALGLIGRECITQTSSAGWDVSYDLQLKLDRSKVRILSRQVADETSTVLHYPRSDENRNIQNIELSSDSNLKVTTEHEYDPSADSLQATLKLAYLLLEFFRQLSKARELVSMTNTSADTSSKHPIDQSMEDCITTEEYERRVTVIVKKMSGTTGDVGKIKAQGIMSTLPFLHLVTNEDFCDTLHLILCGVVHSEFRTVCEIIVNSLLSFLRLLGEYSISESLVSIRRADESQPYVYTKSPDKTYSACHSVLTTIVLRDILKMSSLYSNVESTTLIGQIIDSSRLLLDWPIIPNFFSSLQINPNDLKDVFGFQIQQLSVIQSLGSTIVYMARLMRFKEFYDEFDIQSTIQNRLVNPICTICTTQQCPEESEKIICQNLLENGIEVTTSDGDGRIAMIVAAILGRANVLSLICKHLCTSAMSTTTWRLISNGKLCTFSDAYFEKSSPFRYLIWHMLIECPVIGSDIGTSRVNYERCITLLLRKNDSSSTSNNIIFPFESPPGVFFDCFALAVLKQLTNVLNSISNQISLQNAGTQATENIIEHSRAVHADEIYFQRALCYVILADKVPPMVLSSLLAHSPSRLPFSANTSKSSS